MSRAFGFLPWGLSVVGFAVAVALSGCPVDNRTLHGGVQGSGGQAGTDSSEPPSAGTQNGNGGASPIADGGVEADAAGAAGASNEAGAPSVPTVGGCADLDTNGIPDCSETIANNADFKQDVQGWLAETDVTLTWDPMNAAGDPPSGSAVVASTGVIDANATGAALRAASQCLPVAGKRLVTVYANARVDAGQDPDGHAEVDVFFFNAPGCTGNLASSFSTPQPLDAMPGVWLNLKAGSVSGELAQSMLVKLALSKPFRAASFGARFDNVLVKVQSP